jgi:hypothetical protein
MLAENVNVVMEMFGMMVVLNAKAVLLIAIQNTVIILHTIT